MIKKTTILFCLVCFLSFASENIEVSISADRFEVDLETKWFQANDNILIKQGQLFIKADRASYKEEKKLIKLFDNIETNYLDVKILCQEMVFDRVKNVINADNEVIVVYKDYTVYGDKLIYYPEQEKMKFYGETIVHQNKNILKSKDIILNLKDNKIYSNNQTNFMISNEE